MIDLIAHELAPIMFVTVMAMLLIGYPVAFTLAAGGLAFFVIGVEMSSISSEIRLFWPLLGSHPERIYGIMYNDTLLAIPFFTFMGLVLERSRMAEDLLDTIGQLFGPIRGGLAYAVVLVGALLAATTGVVAASVIAMGLISLPIMMRYGYDRSFATGTIAGAGTLAQVVPPSLVLIVMADQLGRSVGDMYVGALLPAAIIIGLYCLYVFGVTLARPAWAPALPPEARTLGTGVLSLLVMMALAAGIYVAGRNYLFADFRYEVSVVWSAVAAVAFALVVSLINRYAKLGLISRLAEQVIIVLIPPLALIFLVLGTIFLGIATPTEGGAMGATGALALALMKRRINGEVLRQALYSTTKLSSFVMFILIGARVFGLTFYGINGNVWIEDLLLALPGGEYGFLIVVTIIVFILGCFLDFFEIAFILVPLLAPVAEKLDIDLIWFGIIIGLNLQASFLTPPFGFALFYLRSIAPKSEWLDEVTDRMMPAIRTTDIYKGALPFILLQMLVIGLIIAFPGLVTHYKDEPVKVTAPAEPNTGGGQTQEQQVQPDNPFQLPPLNLGPPSPGPAGEPGNGEGSSSNPQLPGLQLPPLEFGPPGGTSGGEQGSSQSPSAESGETSGNGTGTPPGFQLPDLQPLGSPVMPPQNPTDQN
ncbi:TRAP transporter large permease subunit [Notoacmeibacter ruber]|uniref:TRAP transporter large permease subunit n=1 Tax=Notoacmeibacter ruber TaxID=2670375 RepID=A0A3L7JDW2_9HYPH|nr:TRAP transporter large permease subunit [Notoacmeibacter ruber]RLQ88495.1 TRAP transporter large permease subunit [Notoacmeibacter ruber]